MSEMNKIVIAKEVLKHVETVLPSFTTRDIGPQFDDAVLLYDEDIKEKIQEKKSQFKDDPDTLKAVVQAFEAKLSVSWSFKLRTEVKRCFGDELLAEAKRKRDELRQKSIAKRDEIVTESVNKFEKTLSNGFIILDVATGEELFWHKELGFEKKISVETIQKQLGKGKNGRYETYCLENRVLATRVFRPYTHSGVFYENNDIYFNTYILPKWRADLIERGFPKWSQKIVDVFISFLWHLVGEDTESFGYLVNWVSLTLRQRSVNNLLQVAIKGCGKGILAIILRILHGIANSRLTDDKMNRKDFNIGLKEKTLIIWDEGGVANLEVYQTVKRRANKTGEFEGKGTNIEESEIFSSELWIANINETKFWVDWFDRRWSMIAGAKVELKVWAKNHPLFKDKPDPLQASIDFLTNEANVSHFGNYLMSIEPAIGYDSKFMFRGCEPIIYSLCSDETKKLVDWCKANPGKSVDFARFKRKEDCALGREKAELVLDFYPLRVGYIKKREAKVLLEACEPFEEKTFFGLH